MISDLIIINVIICSFELYPVLAINNKLIQIEQNLLYLHLKAPSDLNLFYEKLLESNDIDDITRIQRMITQDDIGQQDFEHKVIENVTSMK